MNLREWRKNKGLSQAKIAEQLGVTRQAYIKWEQGQATPQPKMRVRLRLLTGIGWWELAQ